MFGKKKQTTTPPSGNKSVAPKKKSVIREWLDALIFAVIAATIIRTFFVEAYTIPTSSMEKSLLIGDYLFVSKMHYGARIPMTPLAFPFAHHTMPGTANTPAYLEWIKLGYHRLPSFQNIERNDVVVFNYPIESFRPVDKRENYIKRCVGVPGDTLEVINRQLRINGQDAYNPPNMQFEYAIKTNGTPIPKKTQREIDITEISPTSKDFSFYEAAATAQSLAALKQLPNVTDIDTLLQERGVVTVPLFPINAQPDGYPGPVRANNYMWNVDNFGPIWVPKKGATVPLSLDNIDLYARIIQDYENNKLKIDGDRILINGNEAKEYTFKMDYYFMMGDNRHNSADSRYWGFVPEDHIVGKAWLVWLSLDSHDSFPSNIRWSRLFSWVK